MRNVPIQKVIDRCLFGWYNNLASCKKTTNTEAYRSGHNEAVLKTVWVKAHGGSNPSASANKKRTFVY